MNVKMNGEEAKSYVRVVVSYDGYAGFQGLLWPAKDLEPFWEAWLEN